MEEHPDCEPRCAVAVDCGNYNDAYRDEQLHNDLQDFTG
jgi:hypothetical protein